MTLTSLNSDSQSIATSHASPASAPSRARRVIVSLALCLGLAAGGLAVEAPAASAASVVTLQANTANPGASLYVYRWVHYVAQNVNGWQQVSVPQKRTAANGRFYVKVAAGYWYTYVTVKTSVIVSTWTPCVIRTYGANVAVTGATSAVTVRFGGLNTNCW